MSRLCRWFLAALFALSVGNTGFAAELNKPRQFDWPQWQGQDRSAVSKETGLLKEWKNGPPLEWQIKTLGTGYSTPSIAAGRILTMGDRGEDEYVLAFAEEDGRELWTFNVGPKGKRNGGYHGPRCTPTVDGNVLYALGLSGDLVCLKAETGELLWRKDLRKDFDGRVGGWGYAESPLVDGDRLLVTPGGAKATLVCLDKKTGETIWMSKVSEGNEAAYSSIVAADVAGLKQYIQFLNGGVVGVAAEDGKYLWRYSAPAAGINCTTPVVSDSQVYAAAAYGKGGGAAKVTRDGDDVKATQVYFNRKHENHHGGLVLIDGYLYGEGSGNLVCIDFKTGKEMWREGKAGKGSIAAADGRLYYRNERGPIILVDVNPQKYVERGRFEQPAKSGLNTWPHPVIANGKLYIRDQDYLFCYDVKAK